MPENERASGLFFAPDRKTAVSYITTKLRGRYKFLEKTQIFVNPVKPVGECSLIYRTEEEKTLIRYW